MKVAISIDHAGKPHRPDDRGAVHAGVEEVTLTRGHLDACDRELRKLGHQVLPLSDGAYSDRWKRADAWGADVYLSLHVDAGGGNRGTVVHDHRSARGRALAVSVADQLARVVSWPVSAKPCRPDDDGEARDEDYSEAYSCIAGVKAVALLLEPGFIDGAGHLDQLHREDIGRAYARGIDVWSRGPDR